MMSSWDWRVKVGIVALVLGIGCLCCKSLGFPAFVQSAGVFLVRIGMFSLFWGIFRTILRNRYPR